MSELQEGYKKILQLAAGYIISYAYYSTVTCGCCIKISGHAVCGPKMLLPPSLKTAIFRVVLS